MQAAYHRILFNPDDRTLRHRACGRQVRRLPGQASLAEKLPGLLDRDDSLFALLRYNGDLDLALLNVKDRIGGVPLPEDGFLPLVLHNGSPGPNRCEERLGIESLNFLARHPGFRHRGNPIRVPPALILS